MFAASPIPCRRDQPSEARTSGASGSVISA
jgi:hypothetical protein